MEGSPLALTTAASALAAALLVRLGETLSALSVRRRGAGGEEAHSAGPVSSVGQGPPAAIWQMPPMPQATMLATAASV